MTGVQTCALPISSSSSTGKELGSPFPGQCWSTSSSSIIDVAVWPCLPGSLSGGFFTLSVAFSLHSSHSEVPLGSSNLPMFLLPNPWSQNRIACLRTSRYASGPSFIDGRIWSLCLISSRSKSSMMPCFLMKTIPNMTSYLSMFTMSK